MARRAVGYLRYEGEEELRILNELYGILRLYTNFFQPQMKLLQKERIGVKVKKKYDQAKTPCERVLLSEDVPKEGKKRLAAEYAKLNPAELKRKITRLQGKLMRLAFLKKKNFEYISDEATNDYFEYIFT